MSAKAHLGAAPPHTKSPSILVAIASYGSSQDQYVKRLIAGYSKLPMPVRVVALSNEEKGPPGAEVITGLPSPDPRSLPFAHKKFFAENSDRYDLFIYSENDTLVTEQHIRAFLDAQSRLEEHEIPGFVRSESDPAGQRFITSIHHHFRWLPGSVVERGGEFFARLSNEHSGCFIVTQQQLRRAIASGGFVVAPHAETYGMLETAASDIYRQCGLRRLVSLSRIHDFIVPHLPNKYYSQMGIPIAEMELQAQSLMELRAGWTGELFEPGSGAPEFRWSKNLYERPDERLLGAIPASARTVLSVGCGWGGNEAWLKDKGIAVCAVPLDVVFGASLKRRGIRNVVGPFPDVMNSLDGERFDAVLLADVLHLLDNPVEWLKRLGKVLEPGGRVIASVPNTSELTSRIKDWQKGRTNSQERAGGLVRKVTPGRLRSWCRSAGLNAMSIAPILEESRRAVRRYGARIMGSAFASRFILTAARNGSK